MILLLLAHYAHVQLEEDLLNLINDYRQGQGLAILETQSPLLKAAQKHADFLCVTRKITHAEYLQNKNLSNRLLNLDYAGEKIGENIAKEYGDDVHEVFKVWMASFHHRENIIGDYDGIGVATCKNSLNERFWAVVFGKSLNRKKRSLENILDSFSGNLKPGPDDKIVIVVNRNDLKNHQINSCDQTLSKNLKTMSSIAETTKEKSSATFSTESTSCSTQPSVEIPHFIPSVDWCDEKYSTKNFNPKIEIIKMDDDKNRGSNPPNGCPPKNLSCDGLSEQSNDSKQQILEILDQRLNRFREELFRSLSFANIPLRVDHCDASQSSTKKDNSHEHEVASLKNKNQEQSKNTCKDFINDLFDKEKDKHSSIMNTQELLSSQSLSRSFTDIIDHNNWSSVFSIPSSSMSKNYSLSTENNTAGCAITEYVTLRTSRSHDSSSVSSHSICTIYKTLTIYDEEKSSKDSTSKNRYSTQNTESEMQSSTTYSHYTFTDRSASSSDSHNYTHYSATTSIPPFSRSYSVSKYPECPRPLVSTDYNDRCGQNVNFSDTVSIPNRAETTTRMFTANVEGTLFEVSDPKNDCLSQNTDKEQDEIENTLRDLRNLLNNNISNHNIKIVLSKNGQKSNNHSVEIGEPCRIG